MSDQQSDLIFQEVDEDLRRERVNALWRAYGKYVIALAVGIVIIVAGRQLWDGYREQVEGERSAAFEAGLRAAAETPDAAVTLWRDALPGLKGGYATLARFQLAAAELKAGDIDAAIASYDAIAADSGAEESLRAYARLLAAMVVAGDKQDLPAARGRFATLAVEGRTWYYTALEQLALIDLQEGDTAAALERFETLAANPETPGSLRTRASQFRDFLTAPLAQAPVTEAVPSQAPFVDDTEDTGQDTPPNDGPETGL